MFAWIAQNLGTILVSAVLLVIVIAIVRYLIRQKKQGKSSCGAGCAHCANAGLLYEKPLCRHGDRAVFRNRGITS